MAEGLQRLLKLSWFDASLRQGDAYAGLRFGTGANCNFPHQLPRANGMGTPDIPEMRDFAQGGTSARLAGSQLFGFNILRESVNAIACPFSGPKFT
jgi:hypothetical protein